MEERRAMGLNALGRFAMEERRTARDRSAMERRSGARRAMDERSTMKELRAMERRSGARLGRAITPVSVSVMILVRHPRRPLPLLPPSLHRPLPRPRHMERLRAMEKDHCSFSETRIASASSGRNLS